MEEAPLSLARLTLLIPPIGAIAMIVGLFTAVRTALEPRPTDAGGAGITERVAVGLAGGVALLGLYGTVQALPRTGGSYPPLASLFIVATLSLGLPALAWQTRWRKPAEGLATIAAGIATILAGFSIGILFLPLAVLLIWVCVAHCAHSSRTSTSTPSSRVDSPL